MQTAIKEVISASQADEVEALAATLGEIRSDMVEVATENLGRLEFVDATHRESAENLIDYMALRRHDLRSLQPRLAALGLSSLGRAEGSVRASVDAVLHALHALSERDSDGPPLRGDILSGAQMLGRNTEALLGPTPSGRRVRIMVTMPSEAASDYSLVHQLVQSGMDCMRINCAHDDSAAWSRMIEHLKRANEALGRNCQVSMDLGGPKLRTGPLQPGPAVVKIRPERDALGHVVAPARVWLTASHVGRAAPSAAAAVLPLAGTLLERLEVGESLRFTDARGSRRRFNVVERNADGVWVEAHQTAYIVPGTKLHCPSRKGKSAVGVVGPLATRDAPILLRAGDILVITRNVEPGRPASFDQRGEVLTPASIGCTLPEVFDDTRIGERIWLDDGRIGGIIEAVETDRVIVRVDRARPGGEKLRADKGINLPDSALRLSAMTDKDIEDLEFVAQHADIVSLSFANSAADVERLQGNLERLNGKHVGIILKIETRRGFQALPEMLLTALRGARCGVMIARGDLAVECGFERLAELQEEILWVCEAAHVPVIWATQVLEGLAKDGVPSRAEITDAAMSERAECVMLNKGPHVCQAVRVLDDILERMQGHATKKRAMLRGLRLARDFLRGEGEPGSTPGVPAGTSGSQVNLLGTAP